ncbi:uncharacterized protein LOC132549924 [Ylistrum balloti]|uniref:uncharacterized protein LOC132549924 n=1 Tax=Ylistrum balloti TaxID=509963 RepID=UPI002905C88A|nr:uncharacterized protein LOC132549924 [Ylistrum balloti]
MAVSTLPLIVMTLNIAFISSSCPDNTWLRVDKTLKSAVRCVKGFSTPKSWQEASSTCRIFHGNLLSFDTDYRYGNTPATFDYIEFWTGMYVTKDRFKVPLLDGVPPRRVNETYYNRSPKTWQWAGAEPKLDSGCQMMTGGTGNHTAYLESCDRLLPFFCSAPDTFPFQTSLCLNGSLSSGLCYTVYQRPMAYNEAVSKCQKEGGAIAIYDGTNKDILSSTVLNTGSIFEAEVRSYFINGSSMTGMVDGSGGGNDNGQDLCFTLNMNDVYIDQIPCDTQIGVICQKKLVTPPAQDDDKPILQSTEGATNAMDVYIQCRLNRNLREFEKIVIYRDGVPQDPFLIETNGSISETQSFDDRAIADYWCELQSTRTSERSRSDTIRFSFTRWSQLIYRGYVNFSIPQDKLTISLHNLGFWQASKYLQRASFITEILGSLFGNAVQQISVLQEAPILFTRDFVRGNYKIEKISEDGLSVGFSFYFLINTLVMEQPGWFTVGKDQFVLNKLKETIETVLGSSPSRRRKRQGGMFLPNIVMFSTESCTPFDVYDLDLMRSIGFGAVLAGAVASSKEICITDRRPLANVTCIGSFYSGASYGEIRINQKCVFDTTTDSSSSTQTLQTLAEVNITAANVTETLDETYNLTRVDNLSSLDVIYTASILTSVAASTDRFDKKDVETAADIVNTMIGLSNDILTQAQDTGSGTTRLVEALETITNNIILDQTNSASIVRPFVASEIRQFTGDSNLVVGLQYKYSSETTTITNNSLIVLEDEANIDISVTDAAIILPKSLLQSANTNRLLLQIYPSTKLFKTISSKKRFVAHGNIAAATLTQDQIRILDLGQNQVKTIFKPFQQTEGLVCGYWDYEKNDNSGGWATEGCRLQSQTGERAICVCDHLTNFAILIDFEAQGNYVEAHQLALSVITIVGLVLSIIGLSFTVICFLIFKPLRKTRGQKVLFQLAISMLCSWVVFLAGVEQTSDYNGCIAVAILLHYFILVTFMWLLVEGLLQYLRFVKVLGTYIPRFMLKASIFAWGVPTIPVIVVCAIDYRLYDGGVYYCWMSLQPFYYAFALPVGLVILINIIVFILVIVNILRRPAGLQSNQSERKRALMNFWAAISIFVLLGLTWIFGYMAIEDARIPFQYIFTICNAFQGFFIFLLFITRDPQVRKEWTAMCCEKKKDHTRYDSTTGSRSKDATAFSDLSSSKRPSLT